MTYKVYVLDKFGAKLEWQQMVDEVKEEAIKADLPL